MTKTIEQRSFQLSPRRIEQAVVPYLAEGVDAQPILDRVNAVIDSKYDGNSNLKVLTVANYKGKPAVRGSNTLLLPVFEEAVGNGFRTIRSEEVQRTLLEGDVIGIQGNHYVDLGACLDFSGRNHDMALDLFEQLPKNLRDIDRLPALVVGYGLKKFDKGKYGLNLTFREDTQLRTAKVLALPTGTFDSTDPELLVTGLPSKLKRGQRTLYNINQREFSLDNLGLGRFDLDSNLDLFSYSDWFDGNLAYSDSDGRVVFVPAEGSAQKK